MTLGEMKAQFVALMNRNDLKNNTALVSTFITQAILRIQRELRAPMMERTILYTVPNTYVSNTGLPIPSDLLELIGLFVGPNQEYELQRDQTTRVNYLAKNIDFPLKFARIGGNWIIGPCPAAGSQILIQYYASFVPFTSDADTNVLSTIAWDAVVYAALKAACDYFTDPRGKDFESTYNLIMTNLQGMADGDELTADAAVSPVYLWPQDF